MSDLRKLAEAVQQGDNPAALNSRMAFVAAASPDAVLGLLDRIDTMVRMIIDAGDERDEAYAAVRRLAGALDDIGCGAATLPGYNMNDAIPTIVAALNDQVVRRIVDECPSCHQREGNHTMECDEQAQ